MFTCLLQRPPIGRAYSVVLLLLLYMYMISWQSVYSLPVYHLPLYGYVWSAGHTSVYFFSPWCDSENLVGSFPPSQNSLKRSREFLPSLDRGYTLLAQLHRYRCPRYPHCELSINFKTVFLFLVVWCCLLCTQKISCRWRREVRVHVQSYRRPE